MAKGMQTRVNKIIPEKIHSVITNAIKQMVRAVLFGAKLTTSKPLIEASTEIREARVDERIMFYKNTAAAEGGLTGAGGFMLALADFPLLLTLKMKMLFDIANMYGFDVEDYRERIYILHIFQLAFSSQERRNEVYLQMVNWEKQRQLLPEDINQFDWRSFQQEYRDYIDLAKLAQLIPVIGAVVGVVVNYRLLDKLGTTAKNAYRMRLLHGALQLKVITDFNQSKSIGDGYTNT
jgi:uncharacterized protein (DUF697 family)